MQNHKPIYLLAIALGCCVLLGGCAARSLLKLDEKAKLSDYNFTAADTFAVLVTLPTDPPNSLHQPLRKPLTNKLAAMLSQALGAVAKPVSQVEYENWRQRWLASIVVAEGEKPPKADLAEFFRSAGYRGFLSVKASEVVDSAGRNAFDYSLRTQYSLQLLETSDKGPIAPVAAKFNTAPLVCSRRFRTKPRPGIQGTGADGYVLTNIEVCADTVVSRARSKLAEFQ